MLYWLFLLGAILFEVVGTNSLRFAAGSYSGYLVMYVLLGCSYFLLAKAVRKIPLGLAYALWEALGITLIALVSSWLFNEQLSLAQWLGILLMLGGIVLLKQGTATCTRTQKEAAC